MRSLVVELERQRYAVTARSRRHPERSAQAESVREHESEHHSQAKPEHESEVRRESEPEPEPEFQSEPEPRPEHPRQRGRHVPAAIRRAVFARDQGRCTYASDSGERCRETSLLELHHSLAFARGGEHRLDNVTLRCRAHNTLAAEQDFGSDFVGRARDSTRHEPWSVHDAAIGAATRKEFR